MTAANVNNISAAPAPVPSSSNSTATATVGHTTTTGSSGGGASAPAAAAALPAYRYRHERVSKESPAALVLAARRYRALRLAALANSPPGAFSSTLAQEEAYPDEYWTGRLARRGFETFVCVAVAADGAVDGEAEGEGEYVAQVTFRGPCEYGPWELPVDSGQPVQRRQEWEGEERWQVTGLYVHDRHRGKGLAAGILREAMEWVRTRDIEGDDGQGGGLSDAGGHQHHHPPQRVRFRTMIAPDNLASVALFRKLGYQDAGLCTMKEGVEANGEILPDDWAEQRAKWCTRGGWTMARVVDR